MNENEGNFHNYRSFRETKALLESKSDQLVQVMTNLSNLKNPSSSSLFNGFRASLSDWFLISPQPERTAELGYQFTEKRCQELQDFIEKMAASHDLPIMVDRYSDDMFCRLVLIKNN